MAENDENTPLDEKLKGEKKAQEEEDPLADGKQQQLLSKDELQDYKDQIKQELKKELLKEIKHDLKRYASEESEQIAESVDEDARDLYIEQHSAEKDQEIKLKEKKEPKVTITLKTFLKLATHALKYANQDIPKHKWVEVIGLLAGKYDENTGHLDILDAYPMGHGNAVYAEIKDYKNYFRAFKDLKKKKLFICGWYHSHPTYDLFLSDEDIGTQNRYQRLWKKSVALVVDPYKIDGSSYGFKIFRSHAKSNKYYEVPFTLKGALNVKALPDLLEFLYPLVEGKPVFLEYDE